ncbi:putative Nodulation receptor kinase precursor [Hibiscus syriacus]|uniref:Nodulation receptor kinase n=1 Tax=Hibiscus syriacus TaxID=106335 RepID=A0A6A2YAI6_HIBSY|nr:putative Nodulation receptor kinase precursor [Hibiscus syriacus]
MLFNLGLTVYCCEREQGGLSHAAAVAVHLDLARLVVMIVYRTDSEGLQHQATLNFLPKAIRSSISHYLFYSLVVSAEMKAEYFPPREDVILQNEAPTDFYILVTGAVVVGEAKAGDLCGEIGVLCYRLQLFTANVGDGTIIMNNLLQHLKDMDDPILEGVLTETLNMLTHGQMDLPLNICSAAVGGDDLLHQLLKKGHNANKSDNNAASKGSENCVLLLLDYSANPKCKDSEGSVPLWEAIVGGHDQLANLLKKNSANIDGADVGQFACSAAEQNNLNLLKEIIRYGGYVALPRSNGCTALHVAVCEGNIEIVKFLLEQGADIDKPNFQGWTPRDLAEQQGHEEIQTIFESTSKKKKTPPIKSIPEMQETRFLGRFTSEPIIGTTAAADSTDGSSRGQSRPRHTASSFRNSLFGIWSFEELLEIGAKKFEIFGGKVLNKGRGEIEDMEVIRDGDHLLAVLITAFIEPYEMYPDSSLVFTYNRSTDIQKHCISFLASASELKPDENRGSRLKNELSFYLGDWEQETDDAPLIQFHEDGTADANSLLKLASFEVKDVNSIKQLNNTVSLGGFLSLGISKDSSFAYNVSLESRMNLESSVMNIVFEGVYMETREWR